MKIIRNNHNWLPIPCKGYKACLCFKWLVVRGDVRLNDRFMNHERIHVAQMKEMLYIGFYLWYFIEWIIRLFMKGNAYRNTSFEREAYDNEKNLEYINSRKPFAWVSHI